MKNVCKVMLVFCLAMILMSCSKKVEPGKPQVQQPQQQQQPQTPPPQQPQPQVQQEKRAQPQPVNKEIKQLPKFELTLLDGKKISSDSLSGKILILDFWTTWCGPCRAEIPGFIKLYDMYKNKGVEIIGIALDKDGKKAVEPFAKQNKINYPIAIGDKALADLFGGVAAIPTTFVIDKKGKVVEKHVGYRDPSVFEKEINSLR